MGHTQSTAIKSGSHILNFATPLQSDLQDLPENAKSYDYVIVGGGTAGCVLASRLSENPSVTVLLVEAGVSHLASNNLPSRIPLAAKSMFRGQFDWNFQTVPQKELNGRSIHWPRGKLLGGTSSFNFLVYHHCAPEDFDAWERLGADGWGYESMKKYFVKSEKYVPSPNSPINGFLRGRGGKIVTRLVPNAPIIEPFLQAATHLGIALMDDLNTPKGTLGAAQFLGSIDQRGERSSTATAYLDAEVLARPNLTVLTSITTEKVLFSSDDDNVPRAVGLQLGTHKEGPKYVVRANKEVVLCAGAISSPHVLMLSGIGPAEDLAKFGIPLIHALPQVGWNLFDHLLPPPIIFRAKPGCTWDSYAYHPLHRLLAFIRWQVFGTGPMSALSVPAAMFMRSDSPGVQSISSLPVADVTSGPRAPDIEIGCSPFAVMRDGSMIPSNTAPGLTMGVSMLKPQSKGSITLASASVFDHPVIDPNYLSTQSDWNGAITSVRLMMRLGRSPPLSEWLDIHPTDTIGRGIFAWGDVEPDKVTDEDIREFIREFSGTTWHPTSTARMGRTAEDSVVDSNLRVHGVRGLRVVDASIFPEQVSGHPTAVIIAVAEKAADLIKNDRL